MTTKFKGIKLNLQGQDFVVPPLNFRSLQALQARIGTFSGGVDPESISLVVDAAHAALQRNYPDMTKDQVTDLLDLENMLDVMEAVMDVSGLKRKAKEPAEVSGDPSTGPNSTLT